MEYSTAARVNDSVTQFKVYEDYLDSNVKPMDLFYLKSRELARKLVEHGHKGTVLSREEFEEKKAAAQAAKSNTFYSRSRPIYYNWKTKVSTSNSSPNFEVIYDDPNGLLFKNKRDKKILNVDPMSGPGEDSNRTFLQSDLYIHVVIYDHNIRTV